jgi:hypothetical protein
MINVAAISFGHLILHQYKEHVHTPTNEGLIQFVTRAYLMKKRPHN